MKIIGFLRKPLYSAFAFLGLVVVFSVGYGLAGGLSTADKAVGGSGLSSASWNRIVDGVLDLDIRVTSVTEKM